MYAGPGLRLWLRTGEMHLQHGLQLQEMMLSPTIAALASCCTSLDGVCSCFPCSCTTCCCLYCASSLGIILAFVGIVRVAIRKEGIEIVGGDEKSRAEIAALLNKAHYPVNVLQDEKWRFGQAEVDVARHTAISAEGVVSRLTRREMNILRLFSSAPDAVISRDAILAEVWGSKYWGTTRTVDQHIAQLRKKLGVEFVSVRGVGYRVAP